MEPAHPLLDQVSSQALTRLAAERGLTPNIEPAGEDAVRQPKRSWKRFLPYFFFALSLFALAGMVLGVANLIDGGWTVSDAVQLALMALLVMGVVQQARGMLRGTRLARLAGHRRAVTGTEAAATMYAPLPLLDVVSAEDLAATRPAELARAQLRQVALHKGSRWAERGAVLAMLALASLAFLGMLFLCGYIAYVAGPWDPGLWLTLPFAALTGFGTLQIFRSARRSAYRGRPWALVQRAFRDSVRVWGSGSLVSNVLLTSTATASVAGAAITPIVTSAATFDLFVIDAPSGQVFRIDLSTNTSARVGTDAAQLTPVALGSTGAPIVLPTGKKLQRGSLVAVVQGPRGEQGLVGFRPGSAQGLPMARLDPALPGAYFTGGPKAIFALQPDGTLSGIDPKTGTATTIAKLTVPVGPMVYDTDAKALLVFGGAVVSRIDPATGAVLASGPSGIPQDSAVCGVARGSKGRLWLAEANTGRLFVLDPKGKGATELKLTGEVPAKPCALTLALRR